LKIALKHKLNIVLTAFDGNGRGRINPSATLGGIGR
jgi:hypothetical protein